MFACVSLPSVCWLVLAPEYNTTELQIMSAIYNVLRGDSNTGMSTMMIHCDGTSDCSELHLATA